MDGKKQSVTDVLKWAVLTVAVGAVVLGLTVVVTEDDDATQLEQFLLQFIFLVVGIGFSYYFGRRSAAVSVTSRIPGAAGGR